MENGKTNPRILFISAHAPTEQYPQAGQKIALANLQTYQAQSVKIDVVIVANKQEISVATDLKNLCPDNLYTYPLSKYKKIYRCIIGCQLPFKFTNRYHPPVAEYIYKLLSEKDYDIVHFEYSHAAVYLHLILNHPRYRPQTQLIISIHDIVTQSALRQSIKLPILGIETARIFKYEKLIYSQTSQIWVLSKKDRDILTSLFSISADKITVKPPKLSFFIDTIQRNINTIKPKTLMFWGAMNRPENEQAVLFFIDNCFQKILKKDQEYKLYIVGSQPSERLRSRANPNIIVTGFVADPSAYFAMVEWGIVPLITGAGIKLKTLEMLAAGIPVISTSVGAEGIDTSVKNLTINDHIPEWVNLIISA